MRLTCIASVLVLAGCGRLGFEPGLDEDPLGQEELGAGLCAHHPNLVFWYAGDTESELLVDSSPNGITPFCGIECPRPTEGARAGGMRFVAGEGTALLALEEGENLPRIRGGSGFTVSAAIQAESAPTEDSTIISKGVSGAWASWWLGQNGSSIDLWVWNSRVLSVDVPLDTVAHVALSWDGDETMTLYVNGESEIVSGQTPVFDDSFGIAVGVWEFNADSWAEYWDGMLDEVRYFDRALSAADIAVLRDCTVPPS